MTPPVPAVLIVPPEGPRQWQVDAVTRAERNGAIRVGAVLEVAGRGSVVRDPALSLLATLERLINSVWTTSVPAPRTRSLRRRCRAQRAWPRLRIMKARRGARRVTAGETWPLVINLSAQPSELLRCLATIGVVEFTLGNSRDLDDALDAFRTGRSTIEMSVSLVTASGCRTVGHATAAVRERTMVVSSLELLLARAAVVLGRGIGAASAVSPESQPEADGGAVMSPLSLAGAARLLSWAVGDYARTARGRLQDGLPRWFLAYRESPHDFVVNTLTCTPNGLSIIPPPAGHFHADPCVFRHRGVDHVFFEDFDFATRRGVISWIQRLGPGAFSPPQPVLERPYHLSYPFVFAFGDDVFMIPESSAVRRVELYRAADFPRRWELVKVLLDDVAAVDATLVEYAGRWWMFATVAEAESSTSDELFIYHAATPLDEWVPHAGNPVKSDVRSARPAGRLFVRQGALIRPAQNCSALYGGSVALCEVLELTPSIYRERVVADLGPLWTAGNSRFHTLSFSEGLEVIDGNFAAGIPVPGVA